MKESQKVGIFCSARLGYVHSMQVSQITFNKLYSSKNKANQLNLVNFKLRAHRICYISMRKFSPSKRHKMKKVTKFLTSNLELRTQQSLHRRPQHRALDETRGYSVDKRISVMLCPAEETHRFTTIFAASELGAHCCDVPS